MSLSDSLVICAADHINFYTWICIDSQKVKMFETDFIFEKKDTWQMKVEHHHIECIANTKTELMLHDDHRIELSFASLSRSYLNPGLIKIGHSQIGSAIMCDGVIDAEDHLITLIRKDSQIHYECITESVVSINGQIASKTGMIHAPALLECGLLKVFVGKEYAVFNHCVLVNSSDVPEFHPLVPVVLNPVYDRYIPVLKQEKKTIRIPDFPVISSVQTFSLFSVGPMLTMSFASLLTAWISYRTTGNATSLILPSMMIFSALFWPLTGSLFQRFKLMKLKRKCRNQYISECEEKEREALQIKEERLENTIDPEKLDIHQFFQVRPEHPQFLKLAIGYGTIKDVIEVKETNLCPDYSETICVDHYHSLLKTCSIMEHALIEADLNRHRCIAFTGSAKRIRTFAQRIMVSLISMTDIKSVQFFLFSDDEQLNWKFRTMHVFMYNGKCSIIDQSVSLMHAEQLLSECFHKKVVCFVLNTAFFLSIADHLRQSCHAVYFLSHHELIPSECTKVFHLHQHGKISPCDAELIFNDDEQFLQRILALQKARQTSLKRKHHPSETWLDSLNELNETKILQGWSEPFVPKGILGITFQHELIELDISEHGEGPHGIVAGATGSGKSVLLLSFLLSLAIRCSPLDLQMLIVDYKGGSLFQQLHYQGHVLPHLCGVLSNQSSYIGRTLASISYECTRRQKLFDQAGKVSGRTISDLDEYRFVCASYPNLDHLAHLLIIVDEFAELKREEPQFLISLISLSRIGRSLGLHLILSTQKVNGVVDDEITGNARFKIALRLAKASESREVIGVEDASTLKRAGQFVLVSDQRKVTGKSLYCLGPADHESSSVKLIDSCGHVIKNSAAVLSDGLRQNEKVVKLLAKAAKQKNLHIKQLWLPPLKMKHADALLRRNQLFLGILDLPEIRAQKAYYVSFEQHVLLGFETEAQRMLLLQFFLRQLLHASEAVLYYVQLVTKVRPSDQCIQPVKDQMERFIAKLSCAQNEKTIVLIDDLSEFLDYFENASVLHGLMMKAASRQIQFIALSRAPASLSHLLLEQFRCKVVFCDLNDSDAMTLFKVRRDTNRIASRSQGYTLYQEKLCVVQLESLSDKIQENTALSTVAYMPEVLNCTLEKTVGMSYETLDFIDANELIVTGMNFSDCQEYSKLLMHHGVSVELMDYDQLLEKYTRSQLRKKCVLWVGNQYHLQMILMNDLKIRQPQHNKEGMMVRNGTVECIRLYDQG